jgi:hypothetical protein
MFALHQTHENKLLESRKIGASPIRQGIFYPTRVMIALSESALEFQTSQADGCVCGFAELIGN